MSNYNNIKKTIEENFSGRDFDTLSKFWATDILKSLELTQSVMKEFHRNIVMQANLSDIDKKILSFFFNISLEQNLKLLAAIGRSIVIDEKHIYATYADVLHERVIIASSQFLEKIYLPQRVKWLLKNNSFLSEMQSFVSECFEKWPMAKSNLKHLYKSKKFYDECILIYTEKHKEMGNVALHVHREEILYKEMQIQPSEWVIVNFFAQQAMHLSDPTKHNPISKNLFFWEIERRIRISHEEKYKIEKDQKWKLKVAMKQKSTIKQEETPKKSIALTKAKILTPEQEKLIQDLEKTMIDRVTIDINYIKRMLKKWWPIYLESFVQDMREWYSESLLAEIVAILEKFDVEIITNKDSEIEAMVKKPIKPSPKPKQQNIVEQVKSKTLEGIKETPEKLTRDIFISICKELWYRFRDEKKFKSELKKYLPQNPGSNPGIIQKKLTSKIWKDESREMRIWWEQWGRWEKYQRLAVHHNVRMVKQGNTIVRISSYDDYVKRVHLDFLTNNINYDNLILTMRKEGDIDPTCI